MTTSRARTRALSRASARRRSRLHPECQRDLCELDQHLPRAAVERGERIAGTHYQPRREQPARIWNADHLRAAHIAPFDMHVVEPGLRNAALVDRDCRTQEPVI